MSQATVALTGHPKWPGPKSLSPFGELRAAWDNPLALFDKSAKEYGPLVALRFLWLRYLLVTDPAAAHHVLVENAKNYTKSKSYDGLKLMLGQGLLTNEGEPWKRQRRLTQPAFHRDKIAAFADTIARVGVDERSRWEEHAKTERVVDLHEEMMHLTLRAVGLCLLGTDLGKDAQELGEALNVGLRWINEYVESVVRVPAWVPTTRNREYRKAERTIREVVGRVIEERRASGETGDDLLGMLMAATDESGRMSPQQLFDEVVTLTLAGHETTANSLTFAMYLLHQHPDALAKVRAEEVEVLGGRTPRLEDCAKMPFTKAVIEEALRLCPPAWVMERQAIADDEVCGLPVRKGDIVAVSPWTMHRSELLWSDPLAFRPERFLEPHPGRHKLAFLPFGAGPRVCIGNAFAMMEMQILLPVLLARYDATPVSDAPLDFEPSVTLRPRDGLPVRIAKR